jgi:hypothetical protein
MRGDPRIRLHVDLLGLLYMIGGLVIGLIGLSLVSLAAGAATLVMASDPGASGIAAALTAGAFGIAAVLVLVWGAAHFWTGTALRRHRPWARLASLAIAVLNLFLPPIGTALGVYALWVLLDDRARQLFEPAAG